MILASNSCFSFLILLITCASFSHESQSEIEILLRLKQRWISSPFVRTWHPSVRFCRWSGVHCINDSVTGILLPYQNITDKIPAAICNLPNLAFLNVTSNFIPGGFPTILYNCSKLHTLDLSQNLFHGTLPTDIYMLSSVRYLDIGANSFKGDIPNSIGQLTNLTSLSIDHNSFDGTFPPEIGNLVNLEILSMGRNPLFVPRVIPHEFNRLRNLKLLFMWDCNLVGYIPSSFANLSSLTELILESNNLVGDIPSGLFQLRNLTRLFLHENQLSGEIPSDIEAINMVEISLFMNNLTGAIPQVLGKLQRLEILDLFLNMLSGSIPGSFANLSSLISLDLSSNNLIGVIPNNFGRLWKLEGLYLLQNQLYGSIPMSLVNCSRLQDLRLDFNRFTGDIPNGLSTLPRISRLTLNNNKLSGKLPSELSPTLYLLDISNNKFSGPIPTDVANWNNLVIFHASNNHLQCVIPVELTTLSKLNDLQLDGNCLFGDFPSKVISWESLANLNLSHNKISGSLPIALASLPLLRYLDLSSNKLSGEIPSQLGQLILDRLNLSSNNLNGKVPFAFCNKAYQKSFLNNPNLCSDTQILHISRCPSSSKHMYIAICLSILATIFLLTFSVGFLIKFNVFSQHCPENNEQPTWEFTAFHQLDFTESDIVSSLIEDNVIGSGGSGKVYRITINDSGKKVAVKRIWNHRKNGHTLEKQFVSEVEILGRIRHANIVKLWCYISRAETKLLVYEYLENESLDKWIRRGEETPPESLEAVRPTLDWPMRLRIAIGAAQGLSYMHHDSSPPIIHRDVKSSNILLDLEFNAKVADFGLAKISINKIGEAYTASEIAGTFGYIAPEYSCTKRLNEKIDVYSFGVVLLELSTGKEPRRGNEYMNLADWSRQHYHDGSPIEDVLDDRIKEPQYLEEMVNVFKLGVFCTCVIPTSRPSMRQVSELLISFNHEEISETTLTENDEEEDVISFLSMENHNLS